MKRIAYISFVLAAAIALSSCNLDSGQGVFQMAHNATKKTSYTITDVYGHFTDDGVTKLLISRDGDLWTTWTDDQGRLRGEKVKELTGGTMSPIFINESGELFYAYKESRKDSEYRFASVAYETLVSEEEKDSFDYLTEGTAATPSFSDGPVTKFSSICFDLDTCQIIYGTASGTFYGKIENKSSASSLDVATSGSVDRASIVFGNDAVYSYYEDSDMEATPDDLLITRFSSSSSNTIDRISVDEDNIPMGYDADGGYFITFDGDLYRFDQSADNGFRRVDGGFVSDLRYRTRHTLILSTESGERQVGFIYRNGIYVNEVDSMYPDAKFTTAPRMLSIDNNDNDVISTAYIGKTSYEDETYGTVDRYLYATQNNSFIILELNQLNSSNRYTHYSMTAYEPSRHGQLENYI